MAKHGSNCPEQLTKAKGTGVYNDPTGEELPSISLQSTHEVDDQSKACDLEHDHGNIGDGVGDAKGCWAIESESFVAH